MVRAQHVIGSWKAVRMDSATAVEDFPEAGFDFRPSPDLMTFGETARHIPDSADGITGLLLAVEDNFAAPEFRARRKELMRALRAAAFAVQSSKFAGLIARLSGQRVARLEMLQMIEEHELTHRAHLFLCLRMKGMVPATTSRRLAAQVGKAGLQKRQDIV